jgi:hypothetical protein
MTKAVSDVYLGQDVTMSEAYSYVFRRWGPYLWTTFLSGILVMAGMCLCVIPGIIFSFWVIFAAEVFVIEGHAGWTAIQRSRDLVAGHWGRAFVLLLLVGILAMVVQMAPSMLIGALLGHSSLGPLLSAVWGGLSNTIVMPLQTTALILLYYDIRIRKEAFDLQMLAENMAQTSGGVAAGAGAGIIAGVIDGLANIGLAPVRYALAGSTISSIHLLPQAILHFFASIGIDLLAMDTVGGSIFFASLLCGMTWIVSGALGTLGGGIAQALSE